MHSKKAYFTEIVGLRVYLALWVAMGHALQTAGYYRPTNLLMKVLLSPDLAVVVFMIVSGFVITNLLLTKQEPYPRYITRRFFRLFPVFLIACVVGYLLGDAWVALERDIPWVADPGNLRRAKLFAAEVRESHVHLLAHALAHATMLHGMIPQEILPEAPKTFLPAAWSISLEWQFYLIAPMVIAALRDRWSTLALLAGSLVALEIARKGYLGHYSGHSLLLENAHWFLLGIACRLMHGRLSGLAVSPLAAGIGVVLVTAGFVKTGLPFLIWGVFYAYSLWRQNAPVTGQVFSWLTQSRLMQVLGESSYSLYLIHRPLQVIAGAMLIRYGVVTHGSMLAAMLAATAVAMPLSVAIYFTIEKWGIALGHRIAKRMPETILPRPWRAAEGLGVG